MASGSSGTVNYTNGQLVRATFEERVSAPEKGPVGRRPADRSRVQKETSMTDRVIVATFQDTNAAYDVAQAIKTFKDAPAVDLKLKRV